MNKTERRIAVGAWAAFFLLFFVICVLSFQSWSATKALEKPFVNGVTGVMEERPSEEMLLTIAFYIRQTGRAVLFLALGMSGGLAASLSFRRIRRLWLGVGSCAVLFGISYFTEVMKIFIENRHYSFLQSLESFLFAMLGCLAGFAVPAIVKRKRAEKKKPS